MHKEVHTFLKGISPNVNVQAWLELKFADYDVAVQYFSLTPRGLHPPRMNSKLLLYSKICIQITNNKKSQLFYNNFIL